MRFHLWYKPGPGYPVDIPVYLGSHATRESAEKARVWLTGCIGLDAFEIQIEEVNKIGEVAP